MQFIFPNAMGHPVTALLKTFLDQAIMAPAGIGLFFTAMGVLEGKSTSQVRRRTQATGAGLRSAQPDDVRLQPCSAACRSRLCLQHPSQHPPYLVL